MSSDDPMRVIYRWAIIVVCAVYVGFNVPRNIAAEIRGVRLEGVLVGYKPTPRRYYPIVRLQGETGEFELKGTIAWSFRWYDIGARVPVVYDRGHTSLIGPVLLRWGDIILAAFAIPVLSWRIFRRRTRTFDQAENESNAADTTRRQL